LPESEDIKNGLVGQIRDYTVIRTTALGQPVYSDDNDHTLVAWMLSIFAATMEHSDISKQSRIPRVGIAGRFGEKEGKEFKLNKKELNAIKKENLTVVPRWHKPRLYKETTLRNTMDNTSRRQKSIKKRLGNLKKHSKKYGELIKSRSNY
jgi:hypothetical protein